MKKTFKIVLFSSLVMCFLTSTSLASTDTNQNNLDLQQSSEQGNIENTLNKLNDELNSDFVFTPDNPLNRGFVNNSDQTVLEFDSVEELETFFRERELELTKNEEEIETLVNSNTQTLESGITDDLNPFSYSRAIVQVPYEVTYAGAGSNWNMGYKQNLHYQVTTYGPVGIIRGIVTNAYWTGLTMATFTFQSGTLNYSGAQVYSGTAYGFSQWRVSVGSGGIGSSGVITKHEAFTVPLNGVHLGLTRPEYR